MSLRIDSPGISKFDVDSPNFLGSNNNLNGFIENSPLNSENYGRRVPPQPPSWLKTPQPGENRGKQQNGFRTPSSRMYGSFLTPDRLNSSGNAASGSNLSSNLSLSANSSAYSNPNSNSYSKLRHSSSISVFPTSNTINNGYNNFDFDSGDGMGNGINNVNGNYNSTFASNGNISSNGYSGYTGYTGNESSFNNSHVHHGPNNFLFSAGTPRQSVRNSYSSSRISSLSNSRFGGPSFGTPRPTKRSNLNPNSSNIPSPSISVGGVSTPGSVIIDEDDIPPTDSISDVSSSAMPPTFLLNPSRRVNSNQGDHLDNNLNNRNNNNNNNNNNQFHSLSKNRIPISASTNNLDLMSNRFPLSTNDTDSFSNNEDVNQSSSIPNVTSVIVFGFPSPMSSQIIRHFSSFGPILEHFDSSINSNQSVSDAILNSPSFPSPLRSKLLSNNFVSSNEDLSSGSPFSHKSNSHSSSRGGNRRRSNLWKEVTRIEDDVVPMEGVTNINSNLSSSPTNLNNTLTNSPSNDDKTNSGLHPIETGQNWVKISYKNFEDANLALSQNGKSFGGGQYIIGVLPYARKNSLERRQSRNITSSTASPSFYSRTNSELSNNNNNSNNNSPRGVRRIEMKDGSGVFKEHEKHLSTYKSQLRHMFSWTEDEKNQFKSNSTSNSRSGVSSKATSAMIDHSGRNKRKSEGWVGWGFKRAQELVFGWDDL